MARQANPKLQSPQLFSRTSRMKSSDDFLQELDERLRRSSGFSTFAEDTGATPGFIVPGGIPVRRGYLPETYGQQMIEAPPVPEYPELPEFEQYPEAGFQQPMRAGDFFQRIAESLYSPQRQQLSTEQMEQRYQREGVAYPIASLENGMELYNDGSVKPSSTRQMQEQPYPIASMQDGNILWSDGNVRPPMPEYAAKAMSGTSALSRGLFGRDQTVTQPFGQYNPIEPTPGNINIGTDFRTKDLENKQLLNYFDTPLEVVESYNQAQPGSGGVGNRENRGYGNSVLLRLPNGMMIRISHLDENPWNAGDVINPGDMIGVPGTTGNVTGEHADVEVYSQEGRIISPDDFFASVREMGSQFSDPLYQQDIGPTKKFDVSQPEKPRLLDQVRQAREGGQNLIESISQLPEKISQVPQRVSQAAQPMSPQRQQLGQITEKAAQTAGLDAEFGLSEAIKGEDPMRARVAALAQQPRQYNPYRQFAGNVLERIGDTLGIPEGSLSETIAGGPTKRTGQALASEIGEMPEQVPGIRDSLKDIGRDVKSRVDELAKPGEGLQKLGSGVQNLFSKGLSFLAPNRVVGESSGQNMLGGKTMDQAKASREFDTIDPFFKSELFSRMKDFSTVDPGRNQALSMDVFRDDFYSDPSRVSQVFGQTFMADAASQKATEQVKDAFRQKYAGGEWDQGDVERILSSLPANLNYSPQLPTPKKAYQPTLQDYLSMGKTAEQFYAETGRQSELDQIRKSGGGVQHASVPQMINLGRTSGQGMPSYQKQSGGVVKAAPGTSLRSDASGNVQQVRIGDTPVKSPSAQLSVQPNQGGLFNRASNFASGIFKRFFN
jgi:murein DD-endopeptidase MepM/ murein hydrolase activator NlpD